MTRHQARPPNVVLVVLDSVRPDHLSCYGYGRRTTPHIDRLAEESALFEQAYSTSCWTIPAHASLFTGLYPSKHGANDLATDSLDPRHSSLAEYLGKRGYRTACISCNGFISGHTGLDRGFQTSLDVGALRGGQRGLLSRTVRAAHRACRRRTRRDRGARRATRLASDWLKEQRAATPFFLFMNYMECHLPYRLRGPDRYRFAGEANRELLDSVIQDPFGIMAGAISLSEREVAGLQALYDGALHYLDRQVGMLIACLKSAGLYEDTIFILTSDHGESFGEHGLMDHQYGLYEHLIRIPLIVKWPDGRGPIERSSAPAQLVDVLPTLAAIVEPGASRAPDAGWDGFDLLASPSRDAVIAEYPVPNLRTIRRRFPDADIGRFDVGLRSIRVGRLKLIERSDGATELYDLEVDPGEAFNLTAERPDAVADLRCRLKEALGEVGDTRGATQDAEGEMSEIRQRLKALGYI